MAERTYVHAFTDGRDVSPTSARSDLAELVAEGARIATVCGPLLRHGPRPALGAHGARARRDPARGRGAGRRPGRGRRSLLRPRRHGRVRRAGRPAAAAARSRRRRDPLQLPPRPRAPALAAAPGGGRRPDDDDALPRRLRLPGRLRGAGGRGHDRRGARRARAAPAPRRRDGEVRPRHLLLQRRPRAGVGGGDARPRPVAARRGHVRPEAGDVRRGGRRALRGGAPERLRGSRSSTTRTRTWSGTRA